MATEETLEPASQETEVDPDNTQAQEPKGDPEASDPQGDAGLDPKTVKRLADKDSHISKLETELKALKNPKEKPALEGEIDWKAENLNRIKLVKEEYLKELEEFQSSGAKITDKIREKALELAEARKGVIRSTDTSDVQRQAAMGSETGVLNRSKPAPVRLTEHDKRLNLTAERKRQLEEKYPDLKEGV